MVSIYDLYDLSAVYKNIRAFPEYELNKSILESILYVLENKNNYYEFNELRTSLSLISNIDKEKYGFISVKNVYTFFPPLLRNEYIYSVLIKSTKLLLDTINDREKTVYLADCFHNLPNDIAQNNMNIPINYWGNEIKSIREKINKTFLVDEEIFLNKNKKFWREKVKNFF